MLNKKDEITKTIENAKEMQQLYESCKSFYYARIQKDIQVLESLAAQLEFRGSLTGGQKAYLYSIVSRYTSDLVEEERAWRKNYGQQQRTIAVRVATYYKNKPYFGTLTNSVLSSPDSFVVPKSMWYKYCENKYARKILNQYDQASKFTKGDSIQIRSKNRIGRANYDNHYAMSVECAGKPGIILEVDCKPITEAFKGSRVHKVLLHGQIKPIFAFESDLKKARYKRK